MKLARWWWYGTVGPTKLMAANSVTVLRNLRRRVEGLCIDIRNYASTVGNLEYRVESLCRDVLQYRHCIPNHEEVSDFLISAKRILDSESELHNLSTTRRTGRGAGTTVNSTRRPCLNGLSVSSSVHGPYQT